ncbi:MAG: ATP-binding cassette domain-containing protein [Candidatus Cloacimonetes bacterium]|nr:ATP-binding cassette domain-containing protein [Candidatus Cloacimonadota bacterium]
MALAACFAARSQSLFIPREEIEAAYAQNNPQNLVEKIFERCGGKIKAVHLPLNKIARRRNLFPLAVEIDGTAWVAIGLTQDLVGIRGFDVLDPEAKIVEIKFSSIKHSWPQTVLCVERLDQFNDESEYFGWDLIWKLLLGNGKIPLLIALVSIVLNFLAFIPIVYIQIGLDKVVGYKAEATLIALTLGATLALILNGVLGWARDILIGSIGDRIEVSLAGPAFERLVRQPSYLHPSDLEDGVKQIPTLRYLVAETILKRFFDLCALIVYLPILCFYSVILAAIVLGIAVLIGVTSVVLTLKEKKLSETSNQLERKRIGVVREVSNNLDLVRSLNYQEALKKSYRQACAEAILAKREQAKIHGLSAHLTQFFQLFMTIVVIFAGIRLVFSGSMSAGAIIAVNLVGGKLIGPIRAAIQTLTDLPKLKSQFASIEAIWNGNLEKPSSLFSPKLTGRLITENLSVSLVQNSPPQIRDLNLDFWPNALHLILGNSGTGKSVLLDTLATRLTATEGRISLDGIPYYQLDPQTLRKTIHHLSEQPRFFDGSIEMNLRLAAPTAGKREIYRALELANAWKAIEKLPQGLGTFITGLAPELPRSLRSRIALSRALLSSATVYLMDDFFSPYDVEDLAIFQQNLPEIGRNRTLILASPLPLFVEQASQIIILEDGQIKGHGSHEELSGTSLGYREICQGYRALLGGMA